MERFRKSLNFIYFHRRRISVAITFSSCYSFVCYKGQYLTDKEDLHSQSGKASSREIIRMGIAGSLANLMVEAGFHFADTVNTMNKISEKNMSTISTVKHLYKKEGLYGFSRGFSACFYGSITCGFIYFSLYKIFKQTFKDYLGKDYNVAWTYFSAAFTAELITLSLYYPYDMIKCRLQSKNYVFRYKNLVHAFKKELFNQREETRGRI